MLELHQLHAYQRRMITWLTEHQRSALFAGMGLGKTVATLTAIRELLEGLAVSRVLIVAPLRVAFNTWPDELRAWAHLQDLTYKVIRGNPSGGAGIRVRSARDLVAARQGAWVSRCRSSDFPRWLPRCCRKKPLLALPDYSILALRANDAGPSVLWPCLDCTAGRDDTSSQVVGFPILQVVGFPILTQVGALLQGPPGRAGRRETAGPGDPCQARAVRGLALVPDHRDLRWHHPPRCCHPVGHPAG